MSNIEPKTTAFDLRNREYDARCTGVQVQYSEPKGQPPFQQTNLTVLLTGLSPEDLVNSTLAKYAFPTRTVQQAHIEEVTNGMAPVKVQAIDGTYNPDGIDAAGYDVWFFPVDPPPVETDDQKEIDFDEENLEPEEREPFKLKLDSIDLKQISRSDTSTETDPLVDAKLMLKGLEPAEAGRTEPRPWRLLHFRMKIIPSLIGG